LSWLERQHTKLVLPAPSTAAAILKRAGMVADRKRRRRANPTGLPPNAAGTSNDVWGTDFKGHFKMGDGRYCYPLTMQDCSSRFFLRCQGMHNNTCEFAKPVYEDAFREYGLPNAILSDNGSPFGSATFSGLTDLSAWWVRLGIDVLRIEPGHPEQNGRLERLHGTLKLEATRPPKASLNAQQRVFNRFRREFNEERPHEAIGNMTPSSAYTPSTKSYPGRVPKPEYPGTFEVRRLNKNGEVHFQSYRFTISRSLRFDDVGFEAIEDGMWRVHFYALQLGTFNERAGVLSRPGCVIKTAKS
jgi:transposase InsO family protein